MKLYTVSYILNKFEKEYSIKVFAKNKYEAYDRAIYDVIPILCGQSPYSTWVSNYIKLDGSIHSFNTFSGKAY